MKALYAAAAGALLVPNIAHATGYEIRLDGFCDIIGFNVDLDTSLVSGISDYRCDGGNFVGMVARVKGMDKRSVLVSINYKDQRNGAYVLRFDYPIVTGGFWDIWYTKRGYRVSRVAGGTYTNWHDSPDKHASGPRARDAVKGK